MSDEESAVNEELTPDDEGLELSEEDKLMAKLKEAVVVEREEIGALRLKLTVTVPRDTVDDRMGEQFAELKRDAQLPGFRKGHAPLRLVEKRFGSDVGERLTTQLVGSGYLAACEKEGIKALGDPLFWVKVKEERAGEDGKSHVVEAEKLLPLDKALDHFKLPKEGPMSFSCEIELKPEFDLPELAKIPVTRPEVSIDDEDVETELKRMRMWRGTFVPVDGGKIQRDDMLYADMKMVVDGVVIAEEQNRDIAVRNINLEGIPLIGLGDALVGGKLGDELTFEATVPDDHESIDLRGKTARFEFKVHEIKRLEVPAFDEEFLSGMGFDSEKELRGAVRTQLEARLEDTVTRAIRDQIGQYLIDKTKLDIPEGLSRRQTERSIQRRAIQMYRDGMAESEVHEAVEKLRSQAHEQVVRDLKLFFVLEKIAEEREIIVPEEQINAAIAQMAQRSNKRFDRVRDELSKGDGLTLLYLQLRDAQLLDALAEEAEITEEKSPKKKVAAPTDRKAS